MLIDLPRDLRGALEALSQRTSPQLLAQAVADLSARYRMDDARGAPIARSRADVAAYATYRFPATYAAIVAALRALKEQRDEWHPHTLLDLGAGMGAGLWASIDVWPELDHLVAADAQPEMMAAGRELCAASRHPALHAAAWTRADLQHDELANSYDLVLIAYVLGELDQSSVDGVLERAWNATESALVIVEPGTPAGYRRVLRARELLVSRGAHSIAPCPHEPPCQIPADDWMHFSVRLPRSKLQRMTKGADRSYEDEKYSYVVLSRSPVAHNYSRILRHPQIRKGHIYLQLCTSESVKTVVVSKRERELYGQARKASWGDVFDVPQERLR